MKTALARLSVVALVIVLLCHAGTVEAAAPRIAGHIWGIELLPQSDSHGALFMFQFSGTANGRWTSGWGWIEVFHDPLPDIDQTAAITGGRGVLWAGILPFPVDVRGGNLVGMAEDLFGLEDLKLDISNWRRQSMSHIFGGILSHRTFPPTIFGSLIPVAP